MATETFNYGAIERLTGKPFDPVHAFMRLVPLLVTQARGRGRDNAFSYRNFHVAGGAYGINSSEKIAWHDVAGNVKRKPSAEKVCVETRLDARGRKKGMTDIIGFVILGTTDRQLIKDVTGLGTPTLHWCSECRHNIPASPLVSPTTLIVTTGLESDVNQVFMSSQMVNSYERLANGSPDGSLFSFQSDFSDWERRIDTYQQLTDGPQATSLPLMERQRLAQLALSKAVTA